jgi:hypothetical protein
MSPLRFQYNQVDNDGDPSAPGRDSIMKSTEVIEDLQAPGDATARNRRPDPDSVGVKLDDE